MEAGGNKRSTANEKRKDKGGYNTSGLPNQDQQHEKDQGGDGGGRRPPGNKGGKAQSQKTVLNVLYCNARSIVSKVKDLEVISSEKNPDIILITESWCYSETSNNVLNIPGYFIDEKLITNENLFFLSKPDHIKKNKKNLQEIIFPNKFTNTHPAYRASLEIIKK